MPKTKTKRIALAQSKYRLFDKQVVKFRVQEFARDLMNLIADNPRTLIYIDMDPSYCPSRGRLYLLGSIIAKIAPHYQYHFEFRYVDSNKLYADMLHDFWYGFRQHVDYLRLWSETTLTKEEREKEIDGFTTDEWIANVTGK